MVTMVAGTISTWYMGWFCCAAEACVCALPANEASTTSAANMNNAFLMMHL
jgi:hypothetical protein